IILSILLLLISKFPVPLLGKEFIHVFTDKGMYENCDDLWFKGVVFDDESMQLSDRSHTAFVEIIDFNDSVVWQEKYRVSNGMCDGHVYVGDEWKSGEYRMFIHTRGSLGNEDKEIYPKKFLVISELSDAPTFLRKAAEQTCYIDFPDSGCTNIITVSLTLDSVEYHPRSNVKATVKVMDNNGKPVRAVITMSVADIMYTYPPADVDIISQIYGLKHDSIRLQNRCFKPVLSDGAASGFLRSGRKNNTLPLNGKYINVFDDTAEKGAVNIIATGNDGYFDISPEIASSLNKNLLIKPLVDEDIKPRLEISDPFKEMEMIRKKASEKYYPAIRKKAKIEPKDTSDYSGRHTVQLDEVIVKGAAWKRKPKRNKITGYLDSLALSRQSAWVCCGKIVDGEYVGGFLNDYLPGYNHHPLDDPYYSVRPPKNITIPERGKLYRMIKMRWDERMQCYTYELESWAVYSGPNYSEKDLLEMEGIRKVQGYYPRHRFKIPDEYDLLSGMEDLRTTLLGLPRAQTDENGEFTVEFPTSDIRSTYRISGFILTPDIIKDAKIIDEYFIVD
ncbi:MAG: hypothetical protein K2H49_02250, partial [Muribaculaceae bacterium]|nr:hypothetical protein [Muribaculaceae bacterium]